MMLKNIVILCITIYNAQALQPNNRFWDGKWFPHSPNEPDSNPSINTRQNPLLDPNHGVKMGVVDPKCDDGKANLNQDWFMNPDNFTCFEDKKLYLPRSSIHPIHNFEHIPKAYMAPHKCMNETIEYKEVIPTFGPHRPLWAQYGEYTFLPKQRWLHNLEHGAVVMLYHPCANKNQVNLLRKIVTSCLYKHVITPYNALSQERPLALATWGHKLEISKVAVELVVNFIRQHALQGPEDTNRDGQYSLMIKNNARIVSDLSDSILCPSQQNFNMK